MMNDYCLRSFGVAQDDGEGLIIFGGRFLDFAFGSARNDNGVCFGALGMTRRRVQQVAHPNVGRNASNKNGVRCTTYRWIEKS